MERLTKRVGKLLMRIGINNSPLTANKAFLEWVDAATEKLAVYEDAEEQGRLVVLPKCENCVHFSALDRNADLNGVYWHCSILRGEETRNVWHKYSKHYKDYSLVSPDDYCSSYTTTV